MPTSTTNDPRTKRRARRAAKVHRLAELAKEHGLSPDELLDAARFILSEKQERIREREAAKRAVRKMTGLNQRYVGRVQNAGFDYSSARKVGGLTGERLANFDVIAHEAARQYPELELGNPDDPGADHAAKLWEVLGEGVRRVPQLYDEDLLSEAVDLVLLHRREPDPLEKVTMDASAVITNTTVRQNGDGEPTSTALTSAESRQLKAAERTIERGRRAFVEVGNALMAIRDGRLYRATHPTFQDYCDQRWGFTRQRAHQLIQAAKAIPPRADPQPSGNGASTMVDIQPPNERVTRELAKVPEADREEVWNRAVIEAGDPAKVTAKIVKEAAGGNGEGNLRVVSDDDVGEEPEERKVHGVGVLKANEAIDALSRIPQDDGLRARGFEIVSDWIEANSGSEQPAAEPSFSTDLDALIGRHRKHYGTPWCVIRSVLDNVLERTRGERD